MCVCVCVCVLYAHASLISMHCMRMPVMHIV